MSSEPDGSAGGEPVTGGKTGSRDASSVEESRGGGGGRAAAGSGGTGGTGGDPAETGGPLLPDATRATHDRDATPDGARASDASRPDAADASAEAGHPRPKCDLTKQFGAPQKLDSLSSAGSDSALGLSANGLEAYFASNRGDGINSRIWEATRTTTVADFVSPEPVWALEAAPQYEPFLSPDGMTLFYRFDEDIYAAKRGSPNGAFGAGSPLIDVNSAADDGDPFVSSDGKTLYFDTGRDGTSYDIYKATLVGSTFQNPVPVTSVNTDASEHSPALSNDELTIYFTTKRAPAASAFYIWVAHRANRQEDFGAATLVPELALHLMAWPDMVTDEGCTLYFSMGDTDAYDMYRATKPE